MSTTTTLSTPEAIYTQMVIDLAAGNDSHTAAEQMQACFNVGRSASDMFRDTELLRQRREAAEAQEAARQMAADLAERQRKHSATAAKAAAKIATIQREAAAQIAELNAPVRKSADELRLLESSARTASSEASRAHNLLVQTCDPAVSNRITEVSTRVSQLQETIRVDEAELRRLLAGTTPDDLKAQVSALQDRLATANAGGASGDRFQNSIDELNQKIRRCELRLKSIEMCRAEIDELTKEQAGLSERQMSWQTVDLFGHE